MSKDIPRLPCACASLRRATRAVTQLYDEELRGTGLRSTQFTLLQSLELAGELSQRELAAILYTDSTTLTRTLRPLEDEGLISSRAGNDRRERLLSLTAAGNRRLEAVLPHWKRAQQRLKKAFGKDLAAFEDALLHVAVVLS